MPQPDPALERRQPAAALPDEALLWKALTRSIDGFITVIDRDLRMRFLNRSDVGYAAAADLIGWPITDFVAPEMRETVQRTLHEVFATGRDAAYEVVAVDAAGRPTSYSARASAVVDRGSVVAVVVTSFDSRRLHETERALRTERRALQQMLRTLERERQLVSYEIHDGLAQYQAGAIMQIESCLHGLQAFRDARLEAADARLDGFIKSCMDGLRLMRAAATEARRLINGLRPPMLDELGIEEAIESLVDGMTGIVPSIEYLHPGPLRRMDPDVETAIFRIAQESLSNVRKHASAHHVRLVLEPRGTEEVAVCVSDDGVGFDVNAVASDRFGLEGIRQRARLFGREAAIVSTPGSGTRIEVVLPLFPAMAAQHSPG